MTLLVFGKTGQVATELARILPDAVFLGREEADLADPAACAAAIAAHKPQAVINAAAWTAVDKAETEEAAALVVNGDAPTAMARACVELLIPFVHISTDYVFDGTGTDAFTTDHPVAPLSAYGRTKLAGEDGVRAAGGVYAILRTSWVFSAHGNNFLKTMLRLGATREKLTVVGDQVGGPTPADAIAHACLIMAHGLRKTPELRGTYHFSGAPDVSWADFAREIMTQAGFACQVEDIPTSAYPTPAARPANSRMDCSTLSAFGIVRPDWRAAVAQIIKELDSKQ